MNYLFVFIFLFQAQAFEVKEGDILLQPLHCYLCNLIEAQTSSIYSHVGIATSSKTVAEAFISVREVSLTDFISKNQKKQKIRVLRPKFKTKLLRYIFQDKFEGLSYDNSFLWGNRNDLGEKLYCSELVYKLLSYYSTQLPKPRPMKYTTNYSLWEKFFKGNVPSGKIGISPEAFNNSNFFDYIGEL